MVNTLSLGAAGSPRRVAGGNSKSKLTLRLCAERSHGRQDSNRRSARVRLLNRPTLETTMQVAADRAEAPAAIQTDLRAIFVSLELSRSTWPPPGNPPSPDCCVR